MKIQEIILENYRAFYEKITIKTDNKNLFIYGENGSGKSSIYQALCDFFSSVNNNDELAVILEFNKNQWKDLNDDAEVSLLFDDNQTHTYKYDGTTPQEENVTEVKKQNPFYTYKKILRTYISYADNRRTQIETSDNQQIKKQLFRLLVEEILASYEDDKGVTIKEYWKKISFVGFYDFNFRKEIKGISKSF